MSRGSERSDLASIEGALDLFLLDALSLKRDLDLFKDASLASRRIFDLSGVFDVPGPVIPD
jgi:hypothetical protein